MTGVWDSQVSGPFVLETKHPRASSSYSKDSGPPPHPITFLVLVPFRRRSPGLDPLLLEGQASSRPGGHSFPWLAAALLLDAVQVRTFVVPREQVPFQECSLLILYVISQPVFELLSVGILALAL